MKNVVSMIGKAYLVLLALFLSFLGIQWSFFLDARLDALSISTSSLAAINTLKSIMGTMLISLAIFTVLFLRDSKKWFLPMAIMMTILIVVRSIGLLSDGYHGRMALYVLLEVLVLVFLFAIHKFESP